MAWSLNSSAVEKTGQPVAVMRAAAVGAEGAGAEPAEPVPPACLRKILGLEWRRRHGIRSLASMQQLSLGTIEGPRRIICRDDHEAVTCDASELMASDFLPASVVDVSEGLVPSYLYIFVVCVCLYAAFPQDMSKHYFTKHTGHNP